jgi:predicted amidohydrolase YtcJ
MKRKSGVSRRDFLKSSALAGAAAATGGGALTANVVQASERSRGRRKRGSLVLVNGRVHTMDPKNPIVSSVAIQNGRFVAVGHGASGAGGGPVINLRGATVIPGLIESHTHFVSLANRPGYHVAQWELARNVAEVQEILKARRAVTGEDAVPPGGWITAMGAGTPNIWFERRQPTLSELDAAVIDRPVFLYFGGAGPARTNSEGKKLLESYSTPLAGPVTVNADGSMTGAMANRALYHLRVRQTFEDKKRSALDAMAFSAQVGVTTNLDQTLVALSSTTETLDPQPTHFLFNLDHFRMYDAYLALHAEGKAFVRLQMNFLHNQGFIEALGDIKNQLPELRERLKNQFQFFGDDMVRTGAIGEWAAPFVLQNPRPPTQPNPNGYAVWEEAQRLCAKARWRNENSQAGGYFAIPAGSPPGTLAEVNTLGIQQVVETYERMDQEMRDAGFPDGIKSLRWGLQHADLATEDQLRRLKALNCGVSTSGFRWTSAARGDGQVVGPMFKRLVESGIPLALHQDGVHITAHNPWFAIHYATTGLNNIPNEKFPQGQPINSDQQISREQALHMYTVGAAWYCNRENDLGSIEKGKLADLVLLDKDYLRCSDAELRAMRPIMTVVDGKVVHDTGALGDHGAGDDDEED